MTEKNTPSTSPTKEPEPEKSATKDPEPEKSVRKRNDNAECAAFNNLFRQCNSDSKKRPAGKSQVTNQRKKVRTENTSETNDEEAERVTYYQNLVSNFPLEAVLKTLARILYVANIRLNILSFKIYMFVI